MNRPWIDRLILAGVVFIATLLGVQVPPIFGPTIPTVPPTKPDPVIPIPVPPAPEPDPPKPEPREAILQIRFGNSGCTAVAIGQTADNGTQQAITAAHCVRGVGQTGQAKARNGKSYKVTVLRIDRRADCALLAISTDKILPWAKIAKENPKPGTKIWHAGYGIHKPGNVEKGVVTGGPTSYNQIAMRLSVSSGDSGGPIYREDTGEIVSVVCCSGARTTYGASPDALRRIAGEQTFVRGVMPEIVTMSD